MRSKYTQEEINNILLSKKLNEFYFSILEYRSISLNSKRKSTCDDGRNFFKDFFLKRLYNSKNRNSVSDLVKKSPYSFRMSSIITLIDTGIYNVAEASFVDHTKFKIIHYDNITNYYNESNCRLKIITPREYSKILEDTVFFDADDENSFYEYGNIHSRGEYKEDLTEKFIEEVSGQQLTLNKKK